MGMEPPTEMFNGPEQLEAENFERQRKRVSVPGQIERHPIFRFSTLPICSPFSQDDFLKGGKGSLLPGAVSPRSSCLQGLVDQVQIPPLSPLLFLGMFFLGMAVAGHLSDNNYMARIGAWA